jgi:hypothetical protein
MASSPTRRPCVERSEIAENSARQWVFRAKPSFTDRQRALETPD